MWFQMDPGQHVNKDPAEQKNDFHSMVIVTRGKYKARINGEEKIFEERPSYLIPDGVSHEFWNASDHPAKGVLIMYGDGA